MREGIEKQNIWKKCEITSVRATSMACKTPFPRSRMLASIEISIKLVGCLSVSVLHSLPDPIWSAALSVCLCVCVCLCACVRARVRANVCICE